MLDWLASQNDFIKTLVWIGAFLLLGVLGAIGVGVMATVEWLQERRRRKGLADTAPSLLDLTRSIRAVGAGLGHVRLLLNDSVPVPFKIPAGILFQSVTGAVQDMISVRDVVIESRPFTWTSRTDGMMEVVVPAACLEMYKPQPGANDDFAVVPPGRFNVPEDLSKLVTRLSREGGRLWASDTDSPIRSFSDYAIRKRINRNRLFQFAVWTVTDNPAPGEFVGITSEGVAQGVLLSRDPQGVPDWPELRKVEKLLKRAGIRTSAYRVFARN